MFRALKSVFSVPRDQPELAIAQYAAYRKQVPLLYVILVTSTFMLTYTHWQVAPLSLTLYAPTVLYLVCLYRLVGWLKERNAPLDPEKAVRMLRGTLRFAVILGISFTLWAFSLYGYGDILAAAHVAFYMSITIIGCIFCLMHMRAAALLMVIIVLVPFTIFFLMSSVPIFQAIAINVAFVVAALVYILNNYYGDFAQLIESRKQLLERQQETEALLEENQRLANLDSLTGLSNRRWFFEQLDSELSKARRDGSHLAIGIFDLDGFKPVNDAFGHTVGDKVLIEVGRRLKAAFPENVEVARLGGDEFGFMIPRSGSEETVLSMIRSAIDILRQPYHLPEISARVGASAGIVLFPDGGGAAEDLFEHADYALYHAKQSGRGTAVLFTKALATEVAYRSLVEQELKRADFEKEFSVMFQPLWSENETRTFGFEALARWSSGALGAVRPDIFITVAERCGLIGKLTEVLFAKALKEAGTWPPEIILCCNISAKDLSSAQTLAKILAILDASGFDPKRLVLELTETAMLENIGEAFSNLERIRDLGIGVALDDFGVGQSSLGLVHRLPISKIKIDQSFVHEIEDSTTARNIVRTIVDLARNLDCSCIVEGVETASQADVLSSLGCELMQGYYFGRPLSPDAARDRITVERDTLEPEFTAAGHAAIA